MMKERDKTVMIGDSSVSPTIENYCKASSPTQMSNLIGESMATLFNNPALHEVAQNEPSPIIPPRENESIYDWIVSIDRFKPYESYEPSDDETLEELEELIGSSVYEVDREEEGEEE